ncbi:glycosyltransferase [Parapedobacter sp. ISTM3]|uniref:Glycosyl transferases group 1 n=1 Tax=Parapedobacter luteus TaxID=623280 RepID=A0A1T5A6X0_9SPHI|nr:MULTISPECIES: glycosyltransferase [Parapedobacter]MBK1442223.1 glycosyltransferase [Parapedobacter sp. ISTM3]SKB30670.1 Glycosyl transferases group 1 [Parapedobacter luteus]
MIQILYLGDNDPFSTSAHRATALRRLGYHVRIVNPFDAVKRSLQSNVLNYIHYRTGYRALQAQLKKWIRRLLEDTTRYDIVWVDSGELFGVSCLSLLKSFKCPVILYNIDDPTGRRDKGRFKTLLKAIRHYDLVVVVRKETERECKLLGAKKVIRVYRSYDEIEHRPFDNPADIPAKYRSDVTFIGTWMKNENRDRFLCTLIEQDISVSIWGNRWPKSPYWERLKPYYRGAALGGRDYVAAIQGAKICLGFVSKGNRDQHTTRSAEIPYAGGLLCAERTPEHVAMYFPGKEAVFWSDAQDCALICKHLLRNDTLRERIKQAGAEKVRKLGLGNEMICKEILSHVDLQPVLL